MEPDLAVQVGKVIGKFLCTVTGVGDCKLLIQLVRLSNRVISNGKITMKRMSPVFKAEISNGLPLKDLGLDPRV